MAKKYLSIFNDGTNDLYVKDLEAQQAISDLQKSVTGAMHFLGESTTAVADGDSTGPWTIDGKVYIASGTPEEGQTLLKAGDAILYGAKEFVWSGAAGAWKEYGDMSSLKSLAYKDATDIETGGSTSSKLATTSITGVSGSTTVTGVDGSTSVTGVDGSTQVFGCGDNTTVHDTPTLNTTNIYGCGENTIVKEVGTFQQGQLPSMTYDENSEKLTFGAGSLASLTTNDKTVATKAAEATAAGTSLSAGTEVTVATKAATATTVPVAAANATTVPVAAASATTVPTAAASATTVATGALDANDANGGSVIVGVSTAIQNKAGV